jgi:hypothetical protein
MEAAPCSLAYGRIKRAREGAGHSIWGATFRGSQNASLTPSDRRPYRGRHKASGMGLRQTAKGDEGREISRLDLRSATPKHGGGDNTGIADDDPQRDAAKADAIKELQGLVLPLVEEARQRGFVFFDCYLKTSLPTMPVRLQFADGTGSYYEKSLGIHKVAQKHGFSPTLGDATDINATVRSYVRHLDGIRMLDRGMRRRRVSANIGQVNHQK